VRSPPKGYLKFVKIISLRQTFTQYVPKKLAAFSTLYPRRSYSFVFRTIGRGTGKLTRTVLPQANAYIITQCKYYTVWLFP
jgi:hypothetical protein